MPVSQSDSVCESHVDLFLARALLMRRSILPDSIAISLIIFVADSCLLRSVYR